MHIRFLHVGEDIAALLAATAIACLSEVTGREALADQFSPPTRTPTILSTWAGPYVGLSLGARTSDANWATSSITDGAGLNGGMAPEPSTAGAAFGTKTPSTGIFSGYNWQRSNLIVGIEGDVIWSNGRKSIAGIPGTYGPLLRNDTVRAASNRVSLGLGSQGSARVRLGYLATTSLLTYFTAGLTAMNFEVKASCALGPWCGEAHYSDDRWTRIGWTIGAGMETALWGPWLARAEYRYADFGALGSTIFATSVDAVNYDVKLRTHILLTGLAYKLDDDKGSNASDSLVQGGPTLSWAGLYVGFSLGGRGSQSNWITTGIMQEPSLSSWKRMIVIEPPGAVPSGVDQSTSSRLFDITNVRPGLYTGYLWQLSSRWLVGIEAETGSTTGDKTISGLPGTYGTTLGSLKVGDTTTMHIGPDANLLARLGFLVVPNVMIYGAAGPSLQWITASADCSVAGHWCVKPHSDSETWTQLGWTFTGGIEAMFTDHLRARVEYRYSNFGKVSHPYFGSTTDDLSADVRVRTQAALVGLSYAIGEH